VTTALDHDRGHHPAARARHAAGADRDTDDQADRGEVEQGDRDAMEQQIGPVAVLRE